MSTCKVMIIYGAVVSRNWHLPLYIPVQGTSTCLHSVGQFRGVTSIAIGKRSAFRDLTNHHWESNVIVEIDLCLTRNGDRARFEHNCLCQIIILIIKFHTAMYYKYASAITSVGRFIHFNRDVSLTMILIIQYFYKSFLIKGLGETVWRRGRSQSNTEMSKDGE